MEDTHRRGLGLEDLNRDGILDMVTAGRIGPDGIEGGTSVLLANTRAGVAPLLPFSLKGRFEAGFTL